jgi:hypothetical protein
MKNLKRGLKTGRIVPVTNPNTGETVNGTIQWASPTGDTYKIRLDQPDEQGKPIIVYGYTVEKG